MDLNRSSTNGGSSHTAVYAKLFVRRVLSNDDCAHCMSRFDNPTLPKQDQDYGNPMHIMKSPIVNVERYYFLLHLDQGY